MKSLSLYISLLRPHQYTKNFFIFLPLFFGGKLLVPGLLGRTILAWCAFCMVTSSVYIFNDIIDRDFDRKHDKKKNRPIASGAISIHHALMIMGFLAVIGLSISYILTPFMFFLAFGYMIMNIAYSLKLKHIAIIDVFIIGIGFLIRIFIGGVVTGITLSMWIILMTFLLSLFLALAKRRDDVLIFVQSGVKMREVVDGYNIPFLDTAMAVMSSILIVSYIMYTVSEDMADRFQSEYLYLTVIFVILGVMRYFQLTYVEKRSDSPSVILLTDRFLQATIVGWILTFGIILYY